jgi:hypothetical protein
VLTAVQIPVSECCRASLPHLQIHAEVPGRRGGASSREPALQSWSPEFKPHPP